MTRGRSGVVMSRMTKPRGPAVGEAVIEALAPVRERYERIRPDASGLEAILATGAEKARAISSKTVAKARERVANADVAYRESGSDTDRMKLAETTFYREWQREVHSAVSKSAEPAADRAGREQRSAQRRHARASCEARISHFQHSERERERHAGRVHVE